MRTSILLSLLALLLALVHTSQTQAANIIWGSEITDSVAGNDVPFVTLLQNAGHTVTRFDVPATPLSPTDLALLNAADLVIAGRATNSADFQDARATAWNTQVTTRVMVMTAFSTRRSRLGWQTAETVPDSGPTPVVAVNPSHPVFNGIALSGANMTSDYNIMIDRGTTIIGNPLVGGTAIATHPTIANGTIIAEWPAGATVTTNLGNQIRAGPRFFFAGGSREAASPGGVTNAGKMDLTPLGQQLFLNTVNYALSIPEPSTWVLSSLGFLALLFWRKR